jgi:hypothetical protein
LNNSANLTKTKDITVFVFGNKTNKVIYSHLTPRSYM